MIDTFVISLETAHSEFVLPDLDSIARAILDAALDFCVQKMQVEDSREVLARLQAGERATFAYFEYGLVRHLAGYLAALDSEVQAVYLYDTEVTAEDSIFGEAVPELIHLIVLVMRKTAALDSLIGALDRSLAQAYASLIGQSRRVHLLDVQLVDESEANAQVGYGALLNSLYHRPLPVWKRQA